MEPLNMCLLLALVSDLFNVDIISEAVASGSEKCVKLALSLLTSRGRSLIL